MTSAAVPTARRRKEGKTSVFASRDGAHQAATLGRAAHAIAIASVSGGLVRGSDLNSIRVVDPASAAPIHVDCATACLFHAPVFCGY